MTINAKTSLVADIEKPRGETAGEMLRDNVLATGLVSQEPTKWRIIIL